MLTWDCCRTCLSTQNLNPILFSSFEHNEKYLYAIFTAFGIKIEPNDNLPQQMCSTCGDFVNESKRFREKAEKSLSELIRRLQNIQTDVSTDTVKNEVLETEPAVIHVFDGADYRSDDEDDLTLDNFQHKFKDESNLKKVEYSKVEDNKPTDIFLESKKTKQRTPKAKPAKRKPRQKSTQNENEAEQRRVERRERAREEVECEYCQKRLTSRLSLRNHYKIHTGFDVVCEHCGKKFITRRLLLMHCRAKHGYEKTDKCSFCDYRASNAEQVKIHERVHTGEKPFVCGACGTGFYRKSTYLQHVAIHLPEKTVQCDQCPARFKSITLMRIHQYRHRPKQYTYQCSICNDMFSRRRNVTRHVERVHDVTPDASHVKRQGVGKK